MERFSSNIKKFEGTETLKKLVIFRQTEPFSPPRENFLYFRKQKPRENVLYFLKRKFFLYLRKRKPQKNSLYIKKRNFLIFP